MKRPSLQDIVFSKTIPSPKQNDPVSFFGHVQRNLVPEVRLEVQIFYGSLDCVEAQYPGLDYTYGPHRKRLSRHPWHRRLFRTFDELRLTDSEILSLCQWEGTRSAKERYEAETKKIIRDTTADCVAAAPKSHGPRAKIFWTEEEQGVPLPTTAESIAQFGALSAEMDAEQSDDDDVASSVGVQLNEQLQAAVEARSRGDLVSVNAQWEQWMKEALERDNFDRDTMLQAIREGQTFPPGRLTTEHSHQNTSLALEAENNSTPRSPAITRAASIASTEPQVMHSYGQLRDMLHSVQSTNDRITAENAALAMLLSRTQAESAR